MPLTQGVWALVVLALAGAPLAAAEPTPREVFEKRLLPIFKSPNPSSCVQCHLAGFRIGEISVPTKYFPEASSINFGRSVRYGLGVLRCSLEGLCARLGVWRHPRYAAPTELVYLGARRYV